MSDTEVASVYLTLGLDTSEWLEELNKACLLYTSDAADEL